MSKDKAEPMDAGAREAKVGTPVPNSPRVCHAIKTLVAEVEELFPETPVEYSNHDGRNTALDVTFDLTALAYPDSENFVSLLLCIKTDERVLGIDWDDSTALVQFKPNPRTQDSRAPFGLIDALSILSGQDEFDYGDESDDEPDTVIDGLASL